MASEPIAREPTNNHLLPVVEQCLVGALRQIPFGKVSIVLHEGQVVSIYTEQRLNILVEPSERR